jgi:rRNA-processing protein FCF1
MEHPTPWQGDILESVGGFEGLVLQPVFAELKRLAARKGRQSRFAELAIGMVERGELRLEPSDGSRADEELVSYALREGASVATIDGELIRQLRASHVEVLSLRSGRVERRQT